MNKRWVGSTMVRDPADPDRIVVAGTIDGVFESTDNGRTWRDVGLKDVHPNDVDIDYANPDRIWVTAGGFRDWTAEAYKQGQTVDADGKLVLEAGLYRTGDGGETWRQLAGPDADVWQVLQDPSDAGVLYAITKNQARVERSTDGGETWHPFDDGLPRGGVDGEAWRPSETRFQILSAGPDFVVLGSSNGGFYRLDAGAQVWQKVEREAVDAPAGWWGYSEDGRLDPPFFDAASSLHVSPHDPDHWLVTDWFSVWQSRDAGRTWTWTTDGIENTYAQNLEQDPSDPDVVHLALADVGYFRSTDGGRTFDGRTRDSDVSNNPRGLAVPASQTSRLYATSCQFPGGGWWAGQVFVSDDKGVTWRVSPMTGLPEMGMSAAHGNTIVADDDRPDEVLLCVSGPVGGGSVGGPVGDGAGGIYQSVDAGDTWARQDLGLPAGRAFFREEIFNGGDDLAVGVGGATVAIDYDQNDPPGPGRVWHRPPGGRFTEAATPPIMPNDVRADPFTPGRFYLAAVEAGMFRSDDGGRTWHKLDQPAATPGAFNITVDRVVPGRLAASTSHGMILSTDGGDTWTELDRSIPFRVGSGMGAFAGDHLVVGTGGSGVFWIDVSDPAAVRADPADPHYDTRPVGGR